MPDEEQQHMNNKNFLMYEGENQNTSNSVPADRAIVVNKIKADNL